MVSEKPTASLSWNHDPIGQCSLWKQQFHSLCVFFQWSRRAIVIVFARKYKVWWRVKVRERESLMPIVSISTCVFEDSPGRLWASEKGSRLRILAKIAEGVTVSAIFPHTLIFSMESGGWGVTVKDCQEKCHPFLLPSLSLSACPHSSNLYSWFVSQSMWLVGPSRPEHCMLQPGRLFAPAVVYLERTTAKPSPAATVNEPEDDDKVQQACYNRAEAATLKSAYYALTFRWRVF